MKIVFGKGQIAGPISGADETLITYSAQLRKAGHSVHVLLMYSTSPEGVYYQRLVEAGVGVSALASNVATRSIGTGRKLAHKLVDSFPRARSIVRRSALGVVTNMANRYADQCREFLSEHSPDVFHVITPDPCAMVMIRAGHDAGIPVIYQELGIPYDPPDFRAYYAQFTSVLPLCTRIAALSPRLVRECRQRLPAPASLGVLPIMSDEPSDRVVRKASRAEPDHVVTFGFAARIELAKGVMLLIDAFAKGLASSGNMRLSIAGDGSQLKRLRRRAVKFGITEYLNYCGVYQRPEERSSFMSSVDVFVLPSYSEGTPNGIIEAMAHGLPIIASRVGGIPDIVDRASAILVEPGDTAALAAAMMRLAGDSELRASMGEAARERYQQTFSPCAVMPMLLETYDAVSEHKLVHPTTAPHPWADLAAEPVH
ncbi:MAG TPA: glycosyltransferase family 4 protein [Pyrinomonadaceae bacterium]|jgi:glycosyltransferase involved in cell wall biosynthesis|nr:glycosyltransferase family 4 protein [Pyrinomonadaceae bacterium]